MLASQEDYNRLGSALCKAIGLNPKLVRSINVQINCAVGEVVTLDVVASVIADERMLTFLQNESNLKTLKAIDKNVELKNEQD